MTKSISSLLGSSDPEEQLEGLNEAFKNSSYFHILQIADLIKRAEGIVKVKAQEVAMTMSKACLNLNGSNLPSAAYVAAVDIISSLEPEFKSQILKDLDTEDVEQIMKALTQAKYFITKREAEDLLVRFISHPDSKLRATAVMHLGGVATRIDIDALSGFLEDSDNRVKANAIEVLDNLQEKQFIKLLNRFRQDANNRVRANALKALYNLGELDVKEDIRFMLMDPNSLMRASAVWVLGEIGTRAFYHLELLKLVMDDKDELVHKNLKLVLKKAGDIPQVEFLRDALEEPADTNREFQSDLSSKLSVQERFYEPYCELILRGPLIARNQQKLEEVFSKAVEMDTKLVLNFEQVGFIDDAGMRVLTDTNNIIKNKSGFMYIFNCNYRIMEIFQMTRQDKVLNIFQTLKEIRQFLGLESGGVL